MKRPKIKGPCPAKSLHSLPVYALDLLITVSGHFFPYDLTPTSPPAEDDDGGLWFGVQGVPTCLVNFIIISVNRRAHARQGAPRIRAAPRIWATPRIWEAGDYSYTMYRGRKKSEVTQCLSFCTAGNVWVFYS